MISRIVILVLLSVKINCSVIGKSRQSLELEIGPSRQSQDNISDSDTELYERVSTDTPLYRTLKGVYPNINNPNSDNLSTAQRIVTSNLSVNDSVLLNIINSGTIPHKSENKVVEADDPEHVQSRKSYDESQEYPQKALSVGLRQRHAPVFANQNFRPTLKRRVKVSEDVFQQHQTAFNNGTFVNFPVPLIFGPRKNFHTHNLLKRLQGRDTSRHHVVPKSMNISKVILAALSLSPKTFFYHKRNTDWFTANQTALQQRPFPNLFAKRGKSIPVFETKKGLHKRRRYDIPQIECPPTSDGTDRFSCPSPDRMGRYKCIIDHLMCDGFIDCPNAEDEDRMSCMFYQTTKVHLDILADALLKWAGSRY